MTLVSDNSKRHQYIAANVVKPTSARIVVPRSAWSKIFNNALIRRTVLMLIIGLIWEGYAIIVANDLVLPKLSSVLAAMWHSSINGVLIIRTWHSLQTRVVGYAIGIGIGHVITTLAITTRVGSDLLVMLTAMFNPLPAIALLPLAMLWFGIGQGSILFVLVHSAIWPFALNTHAGYLAVSDTLRMAGRNCALTPFNFVAQILMPAAMPSIISGLKISWAFGWRTLIAAELVFGATSSGGGIGWFIFERRNDLKLPDVFAGLLLIVIIGVLVEGVVFRLLEYRTVQRWGMMRSV